MRRGRVAFLAVALVVAGLVGCGRFAFEEREPWRRQAEEACLAAGRVTPSAVIVAAGPIDGPGACGIDHPFRVAALGEGSIRMTSRLTLGCPIIPNLDAWLAETVQPAAQLYLGQAVAEIRAGSYSCRPRNNQAGAKVSEHAYGNAVDVMAFRLADGRELAVKAGWRGTPEEQDFLREAFVGACRHFTTVLGPGADVFHHDHFHLDLARHDAAWRRHICKPIIKFEPRIGPDAASTPRPLPRPPAAAAPDSPLDIDEDDDPYAVSSGPSARPRAPQAAAVPRAAGAPLQLQPHLAAGTGLD